MDISVVIQKKQCFGQEKMLQKNKQAEKEI